MITDRKIFYIDLFSGAGGTTTGVHLSGSEVVACVNHDAKAIESHRENHPECYHFIEDVRNHEVVIKLDQIVTKIRRDHPNCIIVLWASLECTNYSKAKGGLPRDGDSRTLAHALYMQYDPKYKKYIEGDSYLQILKPDYLMIENVREFMSWGPLDIKGKPLSKQAGIDYLKWVDKIRSLGYNYDWRLLNAADYGSYQSRERFFGQFAKKGMPTSWPDPTHSKNPEKERTLFGSPLKKWKPVREVLDLEDVGNSIFNRKKPLVEATLKRIYAGLIKFVAGGEDKWLIKYNSINKRTGKHNPPSINEPCPVVSTQGRLGIVNAFFQKNYSGDPNGMVSDLEIPSGTITCKDHHSLVFATSYYGNGGAHDMDQPCPTLTTKDRFSLIRPQFLDNQYGTGGPTSIDNPNGTVTTSPKQALVTAERWLMNPQFADKGRSINRECFTLIAKMDKRPPYLISSMVSNDSSESVKIIYTVAKPDHPVVIKGSRLYYFISIWDNPTKKKIIEFMAIYRIVDLLMRMLKILELLQIQGFPKDYILKGTQADQKKFIGNAVDVNMSKALADASRNGIINHFKKVA
jgi:DNA (cytosine-5)-methyltransferase 1